MTEKRLGIKADGRGLKALGVAVTNLFDRGKKGAKVLNQELKKVEDSLQTLQKEQRRLTVEMIEVKKGTDEYKKLKTELKGVEKALGDTAKAQRKLRQVIGGGGGGGGGGW